MRGTESERNACYRDRGDVMPDPPLSVVLDCDTANEVDDQFAIAYALGSPALDVRGVVSVHDTFIHGPGSVEMYQAEAERIVRLCGRVDVPCVRGAIAPMETRRDPVRSEGLDFLIAEARAATQPLTIIATGPATDVASLLLIAPDLVERVRVVWLGGFGAAETFARHRFAGLNGRADIAAWRVLLESSVPLLQCPGWPGVVRLTVEYDAYTAELRGLGRPITDYLADLLRAWHEAHPGSGENGPGHKALWDVACVAALTLPDAVTLSPTPAPMLDAGAAHDFTRPGRTVNMLTDLDRASILADLRAALLRHPQSL